MSNLASLLKAEISRVARKEVRAEIETLRKASAQQRSHIAALRRQIQDLERAVRRASRSLEAGAAKEAPSADEGPARRFSAGRLASHRGKLGLSAAAYGQLVGVSGQTIYNWEQGQARPRPEQLKKLVAVRALTKASAAAQLQRDEAA
ncbi:helix-turn-helix transcriptional regulator [Xenophilus arseniciresistens]|uniref:Helix-turn-helix transcriptional regulator n=1 Tax=Xenophilus arseniciresistens TaxID=1283306 RepID=A0AAE3T1G4_9BURK|nr:helix-turn-helix transcriptional regulator [Xenophilus arseniciresistens]MDA7418550.1 helix-turn-helix transcriptional regulator [Xenophilus arseniciresistens]